MPCIAIIIIDNRLLIMKNAKIMFIKKIKLFEDIGINRQSCTK